MEQRTKEWYIARLGVITSSQVGCLIGKGKAKDAEFTSTGYSYLNSILAERMLRPEFNEDEAFKMWLSRTEVDNRATKYGTAYEDTAREEFANQKDVTIEQTGFVQHPKMGDYWGDSPDGLIINADGEITDAIEIKCPYNPATTVKYVSAFNAGNGVEFWETLKKLEPDYYWQCVSHCICNGVNSCWFIVYDLMLGQQLWSWLIVPPQEDKDLLTERVDAAIRYLDDQLKMLEGV